MFRHVPSDDHDKPSAVKGSAVGRSNPIGRPVLKSAPRASDRPSIVAVAPALTRHLPSIGQDVPRFPSPLTTPLEVPQQPWRNEFDPPHIAIPSDQRLVDVVTGESVGAHRRESRVQNPFSRVPANRPRTQIGHVCQFSGRHGALVLSLSVAVL